MTVYLQLIHMCTMHIAYNSIAYTYIYTVKSRVEAELTYKPVADKSRNIQRACRVQADSA